MKTTSILRWTIRIAVALLLIMGVAIWTGSADSLITIHILIGVILTFALLALAYQAFSAGVARGLVLLAFVVDLALPVLGLTQGMLPESFALFAAILHLAVGLAAWVLAEMLSLRIGTKRA